MTGYTVPYDGLRPHRDRAPPRASSARHLSTADPRPGRHDRTPRSAPVHGRRLDRSTDPAGNYADHRRHGHRHDHARPPSRSPPTTRPSPTATTFTFAGTEFTRHRAPGHRQRRPRVTLTSAGRRRRRATVAGSPYPITASAAVGTGPRQLHDHLRRRHAHGDPGRPDDHRRQPDQDLRHDVHLRRHGVHDDRPRERRHRRLGDAHLAPALRRSPPWPAARTRSSPSAAVGTGLAQLHHHLRRRLADRDHRRP